ncbi:MAG TPA: YidC/Oxa1 family membrane protein insertase [Patescibacteria group bacterium]|nr:YidC/Oxa1 family membrane protein insertase [Patescibacteria group bacterium]
MNIFSTILTQPLANGLILFYNFFGHNLGVATILFSSFLFLITRPLSKPQMDSMKKIKSVQPLVDKLKKKYGTDKMAFQKAQAELYKQKGINPGAGCLFQILQLVILITFYQVFATSLSNNAQSIAKLNALLYTPLKIASESTLNTSFLYLNISKPDLFNIPSLPFGIPGVFLILATISQFLSIKITAPFVEAEKKVVKSTKSETDDMQLAMSSSMMYTVPLMTLYFGYKFPSGLALYWLVFSIGTVWQQVANNGWGSLTPFIRRIGLLQSSLKNGKKS